ncbi:hypothetical protein L195_g049492, partial [Trifolium pratense]
MSAITGA